MGVVLACLAAGCGNAVPRNAVPGNDGEPPAGNDGGASEGSSASDGGSDEVSGPTEEPVEIATPDNGIDWVGVTGGRVYFSVTNEGIYSVSAAGGVEPSLVAAASTSGEYIFNGFAFDTAFVYWSESLGDGPAGTLNRAPLEGGPSQVIASSDGFIRGIAVDSDNIYWVDQTDGEILRAPVAGGSATVVAGGLATPAGIALHAGTIYLTDAAGDVLSVPTEGGVVTILVAAPGPAPEVTDFSPGMAVDDDNFYYSQLSTSSPTVLQVPLTGGALTVLAQGYAAGIVVDATNVYWMNSDSFDTEARVNEVTIGGGAARVLADYEFAAVGPAMDRDSVYWGTSGGSVAPACALCGLQRLMPPAILKVAK
jgi:hypothetical protein